MMGGLVAGNPGTPWQEPPLDPGQGVPTPTLFTADGGQAGRVTLRAASAMAEGRRPPSSGRAAFAIVDLPSTGVVAVAVASADGPGPGPVWAARYAMSVVAIAANDRLAERRRSSLIELAELIVGDVSASVASNLEATGHRPLYRLDLAVSLVPTEVIPGRAVDAAVVARSPRAGVWLQSMPGLSEVALTEVHGTADLDPWGQPLWAGSVQLAGDEVLILANPDFLSADRSDLHTFFENLWTRIPHPIEFLDQVAVRHGGATSDRAVVAVWPGHYEEGPTP